MKSARQNFNGRLKEGIETKAKSIHTAIFLTIMYRQESWTMKETDGGWVGNDSFKM